MIEYIYIIFEGVIAVSDEYRSICALCNHATLIRVTDDILCEFEGIVEPEHTCPKFDLNFLRIQPKRMRKPKEKNFTPDDFSIE